MSPKFRWGGWSASADDIIEGLVSRDAIARLSLSRLQGTADSGNLVGALDDYLGSGSYEAGLDRADRPAARHPVHPRAQRPRLADRATDRVPPRTRCCATIPTCGSRKSFGDRGRERLRPAAGEGRARDDDRPREAAAPDRDLRGEGADPARARRVDGAVARRRRRARVARALRRRAPRGHRARSGTPATSSSTPSPRRSTPARRSPSPTPTGGASSGSAVATPRRRTRTRSVRARSCPNGRCARSSTAPGTQSVAWFPDAKRIVASGFGRPLGRAQTVVPTGARVRRRRDDDMARVDARGGRRRPVGARRPARPTEVSRGVGSSSAPTFPGQPRATHATHLVLRRQQRARSTSSNGQGRRRFEPRKTRYVRVDIDEVDPPLGLVSPGLSEISDPGARPARAHPAADRRARPAPSAIPALGALVAGAPLAYLFRLLPQDEARPVEPTMARAVQHDRRPQLHARRHARIADAAARAALPHRVPADRRRRRPDSLDRGRGEFEACGPVDLAAGWHTLTTTPTGQDRAGQLAAGDDRAFEPAGRRGLEHDVAIERRSEREGRATGRR